MSEVLGESLLLGLLIWHTGRSFRLGVVRGKWGTYRRKDQPVIFWINIVMGGLLMVILAVRLAFTLFAAM
jgi:hypothetical protein